MSNRGLVMRFEKLSRCSTIWETIFEQAPNSSPFLSYDWYYALCSNLLKIDSEVILFSENHRPVGIIPAFIKNDTLQLIGDERVTDLNDIIYLPGYEDKILEEMASFIKHRELHIDLFPLVPDSPLVLHLSEFLDALITERADQCPILNLPDSWDKYLTLLSGKLRHELRRKLKKVMDAKIKAIEPDQIEILFKSMRMSDKNKKNFLQTEICEFFKAIATSFFKKGWLRFRTTVLNSRPIATIFSFSFKDRIYLYNTGFDPHYAHLSPGIVTIGLDIREAINEGFKYYDFLRGVEKYKFHFGAKEWYTMKVRR